MPACSSFILSASPAADLNYFSKSSDLISPLPVKLKSFDGIIENCEAKLEWTSNAEINSNKFIIEHNNNGKVFLPLASIPSANKLNGTTYRYVYPLSGNGTHFFRLMMTDHGGRTAFSRTVTLNATCAGAVTAWPDPFAGKLLIRGLTADEVQVFHAGGAQLLRTSVTGNSLPGTMRVLKPRMNRFP